MSFKRLLIFIFLCAAGILFPPLFIVAAFVGWTMFDDWNHPKLIAVVDPSINISNVTADHADWMSYFLSNCESPAEEQFLIAMISDFGLSPNSGMLISTNFTLEMQVETNRYRVDFIANKWLVIEIDGAAYHSSPEAIARDKVRDSCLMDDGYTVLRIPAKIVFKNPKKAVADARTALAIGRVITEQSTETKQPWTIGRSLGLVGKAISDIDAFVTTASAVREAILPPKAAFDAEKNIIEFAMEEARATLEAESFCNQSAQHAELFGEAYEELEKLIDFGSISSECSMVVPEFERPTLHPDAIVNDAIGCEFEQLSKLRSDYFDKTKNQMALDQRLPGLVRVALHDVGCANCWNLLTR